MINVCTNWHTVVITHISNSPIMVLCDSLVVRDPEQYINKNHAITIMYEHNFILSVAHVRFLQLTFSVFQRSSL